MNLLDITYDEDRLVCNGAFKTDRGETTVRDIFSELESGRTVVVNTSKFNGPKEILVGSLLARKVLKMYKFYKKEGRLDEKPVVSVVLEEAPRVLGKEVLEKGPNIFSTIAREGRKFKTGLVAITQLPSLIPREVLANMNTKIILGTEMKPERRAIIESAAQDLSRDDRNIASLNKGETIVTSNFTKFALPIKTPLIDDFIKDYKEKKKEGDEGNVEERVYQGLG